ncbi:MAG: GAF domain-containing protein [Cytophagales bacterium]|nr:GAF domain-containing protein [Bernardetiaceae bacterium]MDW8204601.1 GAF domain-containing protein [Cytophagales bacterium]
MQSFLLTMASTNSQQASRQTLRFAVLTINVIAFFMLSCELWYDLQSIDRFIIVCSVAAVFLLDVLFLLKVPSWLISNGLILIVYGTAEAHLFLSPKVYSSAIYWLPFAPLLALVTHGWKYAQIWILVMLGSHALNTWHLYRIYGKYYNLTVQVFSYAIGGVLFFVAFFAGVLLVYKLLENAYAATEAKNQELEALKNTLIENQKRLEHYQTQLINITRHPDIFDWERDRFYSYLCQIVSHTLQISRVSLWHYDTAQESLVRKYLFQQNSLPDNIHIICRKDFPAYFEELFNTPYIAADDARQHKITHCFTATYLAPLNIMSMLDCPILSEGKLIGVICCENQYEHRAWQTQDILFIQSLADIISLYHKNQHNKQLAEEIRQQNRQLVAKANEVETMNEELNALNEELQTINDTLEARVEERTRQLEIQNQQLREYAFINAHLLRAPLARIRGLLYLMTHDPNATNDWELIDRLIKEANELDVITTKISDILYDGSNLTREDIQRLLDAKEKRINAIAKGLM